ncbi:MAG: glycosyltransferase family 2 protein [Methylococcales bacterium]
MSDNSNNTAPISEFAQDPIQFYIIALNEENNILDCINSIKATGARSITVLDGGSTDGTQCIARKAGCTVVVLPETSISYRRGYGINQTTLEYICFVDADQRLCLDVKYLTVLPAYFKSDEILAGLQLKLTANDRCRGYWVAGFAKRLELITGTEGPRKVIGTPCVFRSDIAKSIGYDKNLTGPSDDTLFCSKLTNAGYKLIAVSERATEMVRASFKGTIRKAFWYGRGDAEYIEFDKVNRSRHLFHVLIRGPIIYPAIMCMERVSLVPFFIIFGLSRVTGLVFGTFVKKDLTKTFS